MNEEHTKKLFNDFPSFFRHSDNLKVSLMGFGFACGDGWFELIYNLCKDIQKELNKILKEDYPKDFFVQQVKEKFGGLRFYISCGNKKIFDLINKAEDRSYHICEICGDSGKLKRKGGWLRTLCRLHSGNEWTDANI